jgi:uncharacterized protein
LSRNAATNVYFDSSALVKLLLINEPGADAAGQIFQDADRSSTSIITYAECRAAIAGAERSRRIGRAEARKAVTTLHDIWEAFDRLAVTEQVVHQAGELADRRALRGFDSIHLASALAQSPEVMVASWDQHLSDAAIAEGLRVVRP